MWTLECELRSVWDRSKLMRTLSLNELRSIQTFCHPWRFSLLTKVFNQRVLDLKLCFYGGINWHYFVNHTRCGWALCRSCYIFRTVRALSRARAFCRDLSARPRVLYTFPILRATAKLRRAREQRVYWKYARPWLTWRCLWTCFHVYEFVGFVNKVKMCSVIFDFSPTHCINSSWW